MALVQTLETQLKHADHRIHRGADLVAHGRQKGALGPIGLISPLLGGSELVEQLAPFADIDPAADDALHLTTRITVGEDPVINRQSAPANVQRPVNYQW